ncbi:hypothetical protein DE4585_04925 [Mycobacteroides salmoniphilum]|uniref:SseB protein N-terminal domain-containing protein n=1 Tax=Mycobacteroides salmoniphilum TaxID=404941 RepID=A0A4R8S2B0_9MYCO|nr:hypothetical protein [Mycobacteroides salmoniphilum]TDZ77530.1 hypothetical protein DE4585_04925 [Mycobacteroides salmoniphilum]
MRIFRKRKPAETATSDCKVFYSTPFGDTNDGQRKLFLLERDGVQYFPVFREEKSIREFYTRMNRAAYMIIEGDLQSVIETTRSIELMKDMKIVIEPLSEHPIEVGLDSSQSSIDPHAPGIH